MASSSSYYLSLAVLAFSALVRGQYGIDHSASPIILSYGNNGSVGPDGPWWTISQSVNVDEQYMSMLPSLSNNTLIVNSSACSSQSADCPLPQPNLFSWSTGDVTSGANKTLSEELQPGEYDNWYSALRNMSGTGQFFSQTMNLHPDGDTSIMNTMGYLVMAVSNSYSAGFPNGAQYTMDTGLFSLYAEEDTFAWPDQISGFVWHNNRTLPDAYKLGYIPSVSYGLHVGSASTNLSGSLVLGGFDGSRCLDEPLVSDSRSFSLTGIALNVSDGSSAYTQSREAPITGLLQANGSSIDSIDVYPDPGVPYLYLPKDTCDALAAELPVTYSSDFNLYLWNTDDDAYRKIISSPHYIAFTFSSDGFETTINVPMTLMNLTLSYPLVSEDTQYFPCSPWTLNSAPYHLGRAFLQGAFLAQNWNTSKMFLAQAPGPDYLPESIKTIAYTDETIEPATNAPSWESTWSSTLTALKNDNSTITITADNSSSQGLSGGAIAGIVVGVIAGITLLAALAFILFRRKRRAARSGQSSQEQEMMRPHYGSSDGRSLSGPPLYSDAGGEGYVEEWKRPHEMPGEANMWLAEAPAEADPVEMPAREPQEMEGSEVGTKYK